MPENLSKNLAVYALFTKIHCFSRWAEKSFGMGVYNDLRSLDKLFLVEFNMKKHYPKVKSRKNYFPSLTSDFRVRTQDVDNILTA